MSPDAIVTLIILASFLVLVISGRLAVDFALAGAMSCLLVFGVLSPVEAFQGLLAFTLCLLRLKTAVQCTGG